MKTHTNLVNNVQINTSRAVGLKALVGLVIAGAAILSSGSALATSIAINNVLTNGTFQAATGTAISGWVTSGVGTGNSGANSNAVNVRANTDTINVSTGNIGFATTRTGPTGQLEDTGTGFFTSNFAVLGDVSGAISGTGLGDPSKGLFTLSQEFSLASMYGNHVVLDYDLNLSLKGVFDGRDSTGFNLSDTLNDVFTAKLFNLDNPSEAILISRDSNGLRNNCLNKASGCANTALLHQIDLSATNIGISNLLPGRYRLEFALNEIATGTGSGVNSAAATTTNTAVGLDNIVLNGNVNVPEPATFGLMGLGLAYMAAARRKMAYRLVA